MRLATSVPTDLLISVDRAMALLETVGRAPEGLTITDMSTHSDLAPASVRHYVTTLAYRGQLRRWDDARYTLGPTITDRFHDLAIQLHTRHTTTTSLPDRRLLVADLADWLDRSSAVVNDLLQHGARATAGICTCIPSRRRATSSRPRGSR